MGCLKKLHGMECFLNDARNGMFQKMHGMECFFKKRTEWNVSKNCTERNVLKNARNGIFF